MTKIKNAEGREFSVNAGIVKAAEVIQGKQDQGKFYIKVYFLGDKEGTLFGHWDTREAAQAQIDALSL